MKKFYSRTNAKTVLSGESNEAQERRLNAVFAMGDMASEPSLSLEKRVAEFAAQSVKHDARLHQRRTVIRRGFSLAGAMALIVIGMKVWPSVALELFLRRAEAAMNAATSAHIVGWNIEADGSRTKTLEQWYQGGQWHIEEWPSKRMGQTRSTQIFSGGQWWRYQPDFNKVTLRRHAGPFEGQGSAAFTGAAIIRQFTQGSWKKNVRMTSSDTTLEGRPAREVHIHTESSNDTETTDISLFVEPATDLPMQMEIKAATPYHEPLRLFGKFSFNETLAADLFKPDFPKTARVFNYDIGKEEWRQRLAKGIASRKVGERKIVIRDLQVNAEGDVFLLYTAGKRPTDAFKVDDYYNAWAGKDWRVELTDEFGTQYVHQEGRFRPYEYHAAANEWSGYAFNGEKLEGEWWIPTIPQTPWEPRRFTLTLYVNPTNLHGTYEGPVRKAKAPLKTSFDLEITQAASAIVPDYMPFTNSIDMTENGILKQQAEVRGLLPPGVEPSPQLVRTLTGNGGNEGMRLTFSPDGKKLAGGARLWDVGTGRLLREGNHLGVYSSDWKTLAVRSRPGQKTDGSASEVQLWDIQANRETLKFPVGAEGLSPLSFSRDGKTLAGVGTVITEEEAGGVSTMDAWVKLWDAQTGRTLQTHRLPHDGFILSESILAPDTASGPWLVATSQEKVEGGKLTGGIVRLWDGRTGALLRTLGDTDGFHTIQVVFSADGKMLAVAGSQMASGLRSTRGEVRIYDVETGTCQLSLPSGVYGLTPPTFSPDGNLLAWGDNQDKTVKLWDAHSGRLLQSLVGHGREVNSLAFSPDSKLLASGDKGGNIILWRVP